MAYKPYEVIKLYKHVQPSGKLFPENTSLEFWDGIYADNSAVIDREFTRRFSHFLYMDFMEGETLEEAIANFKNDVLSVLTCNQKRYAEMYRVFLVTDEEDPITYNYDMTEITGAQHSETKYGQVERTKGEQINTNGEVTDSHKVAPYNANTTQIDSEDITSSHTYTDGQRIDTDGQHTDEYDADEYTLTRKGNIGVQTAGDILRIHTEYWTEKYKFLKLIFEDLCKALLLLGD